MDRGDVIYKLARMKHDLSEAGVSEISWLGITVSWERLPKMRGGVEKRNGVYGRYIYEYRDQELTLEKAIDEILKPASLREALIEAEAVIQCAKCGKVRAGKDAIEANQYYIEGGRNPQQWGRLSCFINGEAKWLDICWECCKEIEEGTPGPQST